MDLPFILLAMLRLAAVAWAIGLSVSLDSTSVWVGCAAIAIPVLGMMTGPAYLKRFGFYLQESGEFSTVTCDTVEDSMPFAIFDKIAHAEWNRLLFAYGVVLCVCGLGIIGYLELRSQVAYGGLGPTPAKALFGILSAEVDNIPVIFAMPTMSSQMSGG
ncbi:sodium:proton antiporter NhaD [Thiorhodococcus minor]|uniref:Uncharacterized protein n=1 Tax=Thiorhodococcus minor TaxID=57489 RepID=A0A6M0K5U9_9GAMM|nr:sodium:proton antiporter NhaD [Thiorhodococcus minor]NEV65156.1 hypothetical protein [Thiorhodococcus minor]